MRRTLVAGFGNVLRGDDGFGVEVIREMERAGTAPPGTVLLEVGTGGIALAQALLMPYDRLIVIDAMLCEGAPGSLHVLRVEAVEALREVDMHMAVPARALGLAKVLGVLPAEVFLIGCAPVDVEELMMDLSPPVREAVGEAVRAVASLLGSDPLPVAAGASTHG
ncbi:MAG: hydrogenase maturation protease [Acidobacteria bacterium]|nr:hydrogenase maturation protease [Acidobacteriota bacterium]